MEKSKALPHVRATDHRFYQYGWFYHFRHVAPKIIRGVTELHITTASVGTKGRQGRFSEAVNDVVQQVASSRIYRTNFCLSIADPCLQAVDYCTWAIQRKWETGNVRSYDLIKDRIIHEVEMWAHGKTHHY